jgi:hypothetical protein
MWLISITYCNLGGWAVVGAVDDLEAKADRIERERLRTGAAGL